VKCQQHRPTEECSKHPTEPSSCINCGGAHPANYSGCPEYKKQLATRQRKPLLTPSKPSPPTPHSTQFPALSQHHPPQRNTRTWAHVASNSTATAGEHTLPNILGSLKTIFSSSNIQLLCTSLQSLATNLTQAVNPLDKTMLIVESIMSCFSAP
jgi:hypothetical protein